MNEYLIKWVSVGESSHAVYVAKDIVQAALDCCENTKINISQIYIIILL